MNKLTPKRMLILSGLFLAGCCQDYVYIPDDVIMERVQPGEYYDSSRNDERKIVTTNKRSDVYVVNNTPHIRKQKLSEQYKEGKKPADVGLVGMNGELL